MFVYLCLYNPCIFESSFNTISIHRTLKGAYIAMKKSKIHKYNEWYSDRLINGKSSRTMGWYNLKFDDSVRWAIEQQILID